MTNDRIEKAVNAFGEAFKACNVTSVTVEILSEAGYPEGVQVGMTLDRLRAPLTSMGKDPRREMTRLLVDFAAAKRELAAA